MPEQQLNRETDWLYNELTDLRREVREQHTRLRTDMNKGFEGMREELSHRDPQCSDHSNRLIVIETERKLEKARVIRRGTWAGLIAATGLTALWKAAEHFLFG
jgi:hypothetical protein